MRRNEAGRHKNDSHSCSSGRVSHREIVADGVVPGVADADAFEHVAAQCHGTTPCEISGVRTQGGDHRCIPDRAEQRRQRGGFCHVPAIAGRNANGFVRQWRDQIGDPVARVAGIGIAEDEDFGVACRVLDGMDEVVDFLAANCGYPRDKNGRAEFL